VLLQWSEAESSLGEEISKRKIETEQFVIEMSQEGPDLLSDFQTLPSSAQSFWVEELTNDQPYYFAIRAEGKNYSLRSNVIMVIPRPLPQQESPFFSDTVTNRTIVEANANSYGSFLWLANSGPLASIPFVNNQIIDSLKGWGASSFLWSPQTDKLAFAQGIGLSTGEKWGHLGIYRPSDGSILTLTDPDKYYDHQPSWSPDGDWLAYISDEQQGTEFHIWKVNTDGSIRLPLSQDRGDLNELIHKISRSPGHPVFSPQGDTIAFERQKPLGDGYVYSLYEIPANGGAYDVLHDSPWNDCMPVYSPVGNRVAFFSDRSGQQEIWLLDRQTQELRQLSGGIDMAKPNIEQGLSWSPDGRQILYISSADEKPFLIFAD
jgi:dipeptidyl aminopeptidase/acylaminoacyl peptidase